MAAEQVGLSTAGGGSSVGVGSGVGAVTMGEERRLGIKKPPNSGVRNPAGIPGGSNPETEECHLGFIGEGHSLSLNSQGTPTSP